MTMRLEDLSWRLSTVLGSIDLGWVQPFLKAIKSGRCSLDQSQDGGDGP